MDWEAATLTEVKYPGQAKAKAPKSVALSSQQAHVRFISCSERTNSCAVLPGFTDAHTPGRMCN